MSVDKMMRYDTPIAICCLAMLAVIHARRAHGMPLGPPFLDPVVLSVEQSHDGRYFTKLVVGNPGRYLNFILDFTGNDTVIELPLGHYSQTFAVYDKGPQGSEIFYFRHLKLRLPVTFHPMVGTTEHQGVLGLGAGSWLWRWWPEYTVVPSALYLGAYGRWARRDTNFYAPLLPAAHVHGRVDGTVYPVHLHSGAQSTGLPNKLYPQESVSIVLQGQCEHAYAQCGVHHGIWGYCYESWPLELHSADYSVQEPRSGFHYKALHRAPDTEGIVLGTHVTRHLFFYHNWFRGVVAVQPSYRAFHRETFNLVASLVLAALIFLWLSMVLVHRVESERQRLLVILVQGYGHAFALAVWIMNTWGLHNTRLLLYHYHWHGFWVQGALLAVLLITTVGTIVLVARSFRWATDPFTTTAHAYTRSWQNRLWLDTLPIQRLFFEGALLLTLWVSLIESNHSTFDFIITLFVATVHSVLITVLTLDMWLRRRWGVQFVILLVSLVLSYAFLVAFNLTTAVYTLWYWHPTWPAMVVLYVAAAVVMPAFFISAKKHIHSLEKRR